MGDTRTENRFDSLTGAFGVLYFGTNLEACFGETLSRYRADPKLAFIEDEWQKLSFMARGSVPKDWRVRRTAVRVEVATDAAFLDVEALSTRKFLQRELGAVLQLFEVDDLDVAAIRGRDRRVTRLISEWAWHQTYRYGDRCSPGCATSPESRRTGSAGRCLRMRTSLSLSAIPSSRQRPSSSRSQRRTTSRSSERTWRRSRRSCDHGEQRYWGPHTPAAPVPVNQRGHGSGGLGAGVGHQVAVPVQLWPFVSRDRLAGIQGPCHPAPLFIRCSHA